MRDDDWRAMSDAFTWNPISDPIPDGVRFVAMLDAERRMICFAPRADMKWKRKSFWLALITWFGMIKPESTHWFPMPDPSEWMKSEATQPRPTAQKQNDT